MEHAEEGVKKLRAEVDSLIAIPNELILKDAEKHLSVEGAFVLINDILRQGVQGISDIITKTGLVNRDFRDVVTVMKDQGDAILGIGVGEGENRAVDAAHNAINNRLLVGTNIDGAKNVLINICGYDVGISECNEIASIITEKANPEATVLWGQVLDETMGDKISVTVIATGFNKPADPSENIDIQKVEEKINSDTISIDNFVKIGTRKQVETAEPKKNDLLSGIFGNDEIYEEDKAPVSARSSQTASFMREPAHEEKKDFLSDFNRAAMSQNHSQSVSSSLNPPAGFSALGDVEQPAIWRRNLEGLSRGISIGKK
jgi:cell division protein FtsZ